MISVGVMISVYYHLVHYGAATTTLGVMISVYYHLVQYVLKYAPILQAGRSRSIAGATEENVFLY